MSRSHITRCQPLLAIAAVFLGCAVFGTLLHGAKPSGDRRSPPLKYQVVVIGRLEGAETSSFGMNDNGDVVGEAYTETNDAFVWYNDGGAGALYNLNDLLDPAVGWHVHGARDINNLGQICGTASPVSDPGNYHAVRFEPPLPGATYGTLTVINPIGSNAFAINDSGDVVGCDGSDPTTTSFLYTDEEGMIGAETIGTGFQLARSLSNRLNPADPTSAYITGHVSEYGEAIRYTPGSGVVGLGALSTGGESSVAYGGGVNDSGQCTGSAALRNGVWHAFRYTDGVGMKDLGPSRNVSSTGAGINNSGDVVGTAGFPFIYVDRFGMLDVRKLSDDIDDNATGINLRAVNSGRHIAGDIGGVACFLRQISP